MSDTIERFSNRVANYVKYRPSYPAEMFDVFRDEMNWTEDSAVADIGSGTGISSKPFLERGNRVFGVEPNAAMRAAAEEFLKEFPNFVSIDGTAEQTSLPDDSVDLVIAAQAYHWFDPETAPAEFERIAKPNSFLALIWNERLLDANAFLRDYEAHLREFANDYDKVRHDQIGTEVLSARFRKEFGQRSFENSQLLDFAGLMGRMLSSSYMPTEADDRYPLMIAKLESLFDKYAEKGRIQIPYQTNVFYARL